MNGSQEDPGVRWMLAFQGGDEGAFDRIVTDYQDSVFGMLRRLLGPHPSLEDLAQETFLRLYRARSRYRPDGRLSTFLYRITYNLALNRIRDDKRQAVSRFPARPDGDVIEPADPHPAPVGNSLDQEIWKARIEAALAHLPGNQRSALVFQHYEGLDLAEIGQILRISPKAVKSLLHRARENLKPLLAPYRDEQA